MARTNEWAAKVLTLLKGGNTDAAIAQIKVAPSVKDIVFVKKADPRLSDPAYLARFAGTYELAGQLITVAVKGNGLVATLPGSPEFHLVPGLGDEFTLKEASVVSFAFVTDEKGVVNAMSVRQPDGVYTAKKR